MQKATRYLCCLMSWSPLLVSCCSAFKIVFSNVPYVQRVFKIVFCGPNWDKPANPYENMGGLGYLVQTMRTIWFSSNEKAPKSFGRSYLGKKRPICLFAFIYFILIILIIFELN